MGHFAPVSKIRQGSVPSGSWFVNGWKFDEKKERKKGGRAWALYAAEMYVKKKFLPIRNFNYKLSYVSLGIIKVQCINLYR